MTEGNCRLETSHIRVFWVCCPGSAGFETPIGLNLHHAEKGAELGEVARGCLSPPCHMVFGKSLALRLLRVAWRAFGTRPADAGAPG